MNEWFRSWFGEEYLRLYAHRDAEDAAPAADLINRLVPLAGRRVLDLACGPGRHLTPLAAHGARVVGCDLSAVLLTRARADHPAARLVRADMRALPFAPARFDVVVNLFTSFGYFADDDEHAAVLIAVGALLAPGGRFVLDYLNAPRVRARLVAREQRQLGGDPVDIRRAISADDRYVEKSVTSTTDGRRWVERVRLFTPDDLTGMLTAAGLAVEAMLGDFTGAPWRADTQRTIVVAARP